MRGTKKKKQTKRIRKADCGFKDGKDGTGSEQLIRHGPTILVDIGFDPSYVPGKGLVPTPGAKDLPALVDTGASEIFIDTQLAVALNLPIIDHNRALGGAGGETLADVYLAQISIPALKSLIYGEFCGVNLTEAGMIHRALIGRTFLQDHTLTYRGKTGRVTLAQ